MLSTVLDFPGGGGYECIYIMAAIRDSCNSSAVTSSFFHTDFLQEESVTDIITVLAAKNSKSYDNRQMCHCPEGYEILGKGKGNQHPWVFGWYRL